MAEHPVAFCIAVIAVLIWAVSGPIFKFSDTWQLAINTGTIVTFLMVFLIQNAQNRDSEAVQLQLAEIIRATRSTRYNFHDIEELSEEELERVKASLEILTRKARKSVRAGNSNLGCPEVKPGWSRVQLFVPTFNNDNSALLDGTTKHQRKENI